MKQGTLFDPGPKATSGDYLADSRYARSADKPTSMMAATSILPELKGCKAAIRDVASKAKPMTSYELARDAVRLRTIRGDQNIPSVETHRKRASLAEMGGWLQEAGTKVCEVTGNEATAFVEA